jgi:hypothetical protein
MKFRKPTENKLTSEEILNQASKCNHEELEKLLMHIQIKVEQFNNKTQDHDLLRAKTMIISRLASMRSN